MKTTPPPADSATYTVRVPTVLKKAFDSVASLQERNGSQLLREFMRDYVQRNADQALAHDDWFRRQVESTRAGIAAGTQATTDAANVHAWLETWGTTGEMSAPLSETKEGAQKATEKATERPSKPRRSAKTPA